MKTAVAGDDDEHRFAAGGYVTGGYIPTGPTFVINDRGLAERVVTAAEWAELRTDAEAIVAKMRRRVLLQRIVDRLAELVRPLTTFGP